MRTTTRPLRAAGRGATAQALRLPARRLFCARSVLLAIVMSAVYARSKAVVNLELVTTWQKYQPVFQRFQLILVQLYCDAVYVSMRIGLARLVCSRDVEVGA